MRVRGERVIRIERDTHGTPVVRASLETDLYRGLGFCHATDRALQLLLVRLIGEGRLSEHLDPSDEALQTDLFFRRLNPAVGAAKELAKLAAHHRALLEAYCDGVNQALARRVPWELRAFGYRPPPWTAADCILMSRVSGYVSLAQSQGDMERVLVEMVHAGAPKEHLAELFGDALASLDVSLLERVRIADRFVPDAVRWCTALPRAVASNNWVLAGRKTRSGNTLLANDPHLELNRLPALWHEVILRLNERFCIAATFPGLGTVGIGRTPNLAWGATYAFMDAIDSWIEDCRDGRYRRATSHGDEWQPFRERRETILRRKKEPVTVTFFENDHGVLNGEPEAPGLRLSTRWAAGSEAGAATLAALFDIVHAETVAEGMQTLRHIETAWNFVLADSNGDIGYQMSGRMPRRPTGERGLVPLPGWDPSNDWQGFVDPEDLPRAFNPECGFIVTANDDLNHLGRAKPLNLPMGAYRAERIAERLEARDDWDLETTERLQMDVYSRQAARFMQILRPLLPATPAGDVLRCWDLSYDLESEGASWFERFYRALIIDVFGSVCGPDVAQHLIDQTGIVVDFYANFDTVLLNPESVWYGSEGRDAAFERVAATSLMGSVEPWGNVNSIPMRHLLFGGRLPAWLGFDRGPIRLRGGRATVHQGQVYVSGGRTTSFAPSYRMITDLGEPCVHTSLAGGASDRRFSRWYASRLADWLAGRTQRLAP